MTENALIRSISGNIQVAAPLSIVAPGALYEIDFSDGEAKARNRSFSRPPGVRLHCAGDIDEDQREGEFLTADSSSRPY